MAVLSLGLMHAFLVRMSLKGTVQRKLRGVLSGINRKHVIWAWAAWG
jgi:hypothetical protein